MAKVWEYQGTYDNQTTIVVEDARPGNDGFYIDHVKHDKTSLTPQFQKKLNYQTSTSDNSWLFPMDSSFSTDYTRNGQQLALSKMTGSMSGMESDSTNYQNYVWPGSWMDMSGTLKMGTMNLVSNGTQETQIHSYHNSSYQYIRKWPHMEDSIDLYERNPTAGGTGNVGGGNTQHSAYLHETVGNDDYVMNFHRGNGSTNQYNYPNYRWEVFYGSTGAFPNAQPSTTGSDISGMGNYYNVQYLGKSAVDGGILFVGTMSRTTGNGLRLKVVKAVWTTSTTPTWTVMCDFNVVPTASGTSQGGNNMNNNYVPTNCTEVFDDPRGTANTKVFYRNYYDSYHNFHPFVITWNTTNDTFARETDITCDVLSSVHSDMSGTSFQGSSSAVCEQFNLQTWNGASLRYICDMKLDGRPSAKDSDAAYRTWVTYSVGASDPKALTYHSKITMPSTPRSLIWLNDSHTMMGIWFKSTFGIYSWNDTTGWNQTTLLAHKVQNIGRDSLDRIWYIRPSSKYGSTKPELHLLTPTLPVTISVAPENATYTYSGSTITSYINVSAINASGARIASSVKLVIEGSSMTFSDDSTSKTVTTLTSGDLQVATKVISAGFTNVSASIEI